jgi:opacity protein-like surface antigen
MFRILLVAALGAALISPAWAADNGQPNAGTGKGAAAGAAAGHEVGKGHAAAGAATGAAVGHHEKSKAESNK